MLIPHLPVVVGVVGSTESLGALCWAVDVAARFDSPLRVVPAVDRTVRS